MLSVLPLLKQIRKIAFLACLLMGITLSHADYLSPASHQAEEPIIDLHSLQQLFESLEQHSQLLATETENYIRCLKQNTQAEDETLPDNQSLPPEITREWLNKLLGSLSAGVSSSETCQFLLDDLLQKLPQMPAEEPQQSQSI
ncbi:hypothetical protein [Aliamphritea ceti]|uniref:hypothetical protein n=1 Tax=Aliamphritea ceti TaxID=1524258 RepID=UPI0021C3F026|nr:hypothetical protein [Aliamphritea ceti]